MIDKLNKRLSAFVIFLILFILLIVNLYIMIDYRNNYNEYLEYKTKLFDNSIEQIFTTYEQFSDFIFETEINSDEVKEIFAQAGNANSEEKDMLRGELYLYFEDFYALLLDYNFKQMHFHFSDGESFLRVHYPELYGDNLFSIRESVRIANEEEHFVSGFEEGRIFNGYRYVYPLEYQQEHIGSAELSISVENILSDLYKYNLISTDIGFIMKKEVVKRSAYEETLDDYVESFISKDYYMDASTLEIMENSDNSLKIYKDDSFIKKLVKEMDKDLKEEKSFSKEIKYKDAYYLVQAASIRNIAGENIGYFISISIDDEVKILKRNNIRWVIFSILIMLITTSMALFLIKKQIEVQKLAMIDQLTKIYNRRFFFEISEKELRKAIRDESNICVAMLDIDRFKMVNDTYGHLEGDNVLTALAKLVGEVIRDKDIFARFGGEEFVLLLPQTNSDEAKSIVERIRKEVEEFDFSPIKKITISIGFAKVDTSKRLEKSIDRADEALYMAKKLGRNRVVEYENKN